MDFITKFSDHLRLELMRSPLTMKAYEADLRAFELYLDDTPIQDALYADVRSYVMIMVERGDSARSVNRRMSALRAFFNFLLVSDVIGVNPCTKIHSLKTEQRLPHFVQRDVIERLFDIELDDDHFSDFIILKTLYFTGMRRAELVSLDVDSVDFGQQWIKFIGKGSKERIVPLTDSLVNDLKRYLDIRSRKICNSNQKALFLNSEGERISADWVYTVVNEWLTFAGVDGKRSPHVLRHTFATHLTASEVGVRTIQQLLGHASIASTQIYAHNTIDTLKSSYNKAHPRAIKSKKL